MSHEAQPKRILVVDDEEFVRLLVGQILGRSGYTLDYAADGEAALAQMAAAPPDLVILDLMMPGMNGWAVLERMRALPRMPPVVILTAHGSYETFTRVVREGVVGYISKPFSLDELLLTCARALASQYTGGEGDRRGDWRRPLVVRVRILNPEATSMAVGELVNLSLQGGQVDLAVPLRQGERIRLTFDIPGGEEKERPLVLEAVVEWQQAGQGRYLHGLAFRDLDGVTQRELRELLQPADRPDRS